MKHLLLILSFIVTLNFTGHAQADVGSITGIAEDLVKLKRFEEALEKYNEALDYLPSYAPAIDGKANLLIMLEDYKAAGKLIDDAIKKNSDYPHFYLTRGKILIHKDKYEDAIDDLNRALDLSKGSNDKLLENKIYVNRGAAYQKLLKYDAALSDYSKAIQLNDNNPNVFLYRGYLFYKTNEYEEALRDFNIVIEIDPENPFAYYNRGMIHLKQVKDAEACDDFHKACELGNTNACRMVITHCIKLKNQ
ncbi:MAG: tetratricopeptide repeat protein [Bacteroidetes bacterium]|nr:tetratricopeptide repeat protein [Bacteroidota bacterium]